MFPAINQFFQAIVTSEVLGRIYNIKKKIRTKLIKNKYAVRSTDNAGTNLIFKKYETERL